MKRTDEGTAVLPGTESVLISRENDCATITLNQPAKLNALGTELVDGLHAALDKTLGNQSQPSVKLIVFRANGKGFSGGLDLSGLDAESDGDLLLRLVRIEQLLQRVRHASCATAVFVHGACYGAAADLVLACRARIATADARFLMPGMRFGIVLGTQRLRDTVGENAAYQLLDRLAPFKSDEALATGYLTKVAEPADWSGVTQQLLHSLSGFSSSAYANRVSSLTPDTRAADMQALVRSVTESSIKSRMLDYLQQAKAERRTRSGDG